MLNLQTYMYIIYSNYIAQIYGNSDNKALELLIERNFKCLRQSKYFTPMPKWVSIAKRFHKQPNAHVGPCLSEPLGLDI